MPTNLQTIDLSALLESIRLLSVSTDGNGPAKQVAVMTCGLAGSGKTTLAKAIVDIIPSFTRISIDEIIYAKHGIYGLDYAADEALYETFLDEASVEYLRNFHSLLAAKKNIVVERSFWAREDREEFRAMIGESDAQCMLIYLKVARTAQAKEMLWDRVCERTRGERNANAALVITRERFERYWQGFEEPHGEGEIVLNVFEQTQG